MAFLSSDYQKNLTAVRIIFPCWILSGIVQLTQEPHSKRVADETALVGAYNGSGNSEMGQWVELSSSELVAGDHDPLQRQANRFRQI